MCLTITTLALSRRSPTPSPMRCAGSKDTIESGSANEFADIVLGESPPA
jgi:hypothetical protein